METKLVFWLADDKVVYWVDRRVDQKGTLKVADQDVLMADWSGAQQERQKDVERVAKKENVKVEQQDYVKVEKMVVVMACTKAESLVAWKDCLKAEVMVFVQVVQKAYKMVFETAAMTVVYQVAKKVDQMDIEWVDMKVAGLVQLLAVATADCQVDCLVGETDTLLVDLLVYWMDE